jgi:hypothetical protein
MNKTLIVFVLASILLLGLSFVGAEQAQAGNVSAEAISASGNGTSLTNVGEDNRVQAGETYMTQNGEQVQVQGEGDRIRLRVRDAEAHSDLEITSDGQKLMAKLSNGRNAEIKVMPNTASDTALQRLRLKNCNETRNCTMELKQVGEGEQARLAYEVQTERHSRILGLFQAKMQVRAQVDAENGEVIRVGKPWWAFLATEPEEQ